MCSCGTKPASAAQRLRQRVHHSDLSLGDRSNYQLSHPFTALNRKGLLAKIDQQDLNLAPIVGIDGSGRVDDSQPVSPGQPGASTNLAFKTQRDFHLETRGDTHALPRGHRNGFFKGSPQVKTCRPRRFIGGKRKA